MEFLDLLGKAYRKADQMARNFQDDLEKEQAYAKGLSDEMLKKRATHGITLAQRKAAYDELRKHGYDTQDYDKGEKI